ncbi:hypothetical protein, partial [Planobispora rosea]|uniref:hypothetical protein n=1 Tax=Planobispora rosea TaxID=35762 RepID=UPI00194526EF
MPRRALRIQPEYGRSTLIPCDPEDLDLFFILDGDMDIYVILMEITHGGICIPLKVVVDAFRKVI